MTVASSTNGTPPAATGALSDIVALSADEMPSNASGATSSIATTSVLTSEGLEEKSSRSGATNFTWSSKVGLRTGAGMLSTFVGCGVTGAGRDDISSLGDY